MMILAVFTLSACSNAPRCNDKDVKENVIAVVLQKRLEGEKTNSSKMASLINLRLEDVRVIAENPKSKECMCMANMKYISYDQPYRDKDGQFPYKYNGPFNDEELSHLKKEEKSEQIEYNVQKAADTGALWIATNASIWMVPVLYFSESDQVVHYK